MSEDFEIKNKVAESGLVNFDLSELSPKGKRIGIDLKDFLFMEMILKENLLISAHLAGDHFRQRVHADIARPSGHGNRQILRESKPLQDRDDAEQNDSQHGRLKHPRLPPLAAIPGAQKCHGEPPERSFVRAGCVKIFEHAHDPYFGSGVTTT